MGWRDATKVDEAEAVEPEKPTPSWRTSTPAPSPEDEKRDYDAAMSRQRQQLVLGMGPVEGVATAFGENARHAIRRGANLLGKVPGIGPHLDAPTDEQILEEKANLRELNDAAPLPAWLGDFSITGAPAVVGGARALPAGVSLGKAILTGAGLGGAQGLVSAEPGERLWGTAIGAGFGGAVPAAMGLTGAAARWVGRRVPESVKEWVAAKGGEVVDKLPENVKDYLAAKFTGKDALPPSDAPVKGFFKNQAEDAALRSAGADRTATRRVFGRPVNEAKQSRAARVLLDEDVSLSSPKAIQADLENILSREDGPAIGAMVDKAAESGAAVNIGKARASFLSDPNVDALRKNSETRGTYDRLVRFIDDQIDQYGTKMDPRQAFDLRKQLKELGKFDKSPAAQEAILARGFQAMRAHLNRFLDDAMGSAGMGDEWAATNARYAAAADAKSLADIGAERATGNNRLGLRDFGAGTAAAGAAVASGHPEMALAGPAFWVANHYGNPALARTADALSRPVGSAVRGAAEAVPGAQRVVPELAALREYLARLRLGAASATASDQERDSSAR